MKKYIQFNVWIMILTIILLTVLGIKTLETNSFIEVNITKGTINIDARKNYDSLRNLQIFQLGSTIHDILNKDPIFMIVC